MRCPLIYLSSSENRKNIKSSVSAQVADIITNKPHLRGTHTVQRTSSAPSPPSSGRFSTPPHLHEHLSSYNTHNLTTCLHPSHLVSSFLAALKSRHPQMSLLPTVALPSTYSEIMDAVPDLVAETTFDLSTMKRHHKGYVPFDETSRVKYLMFIARFGLVMRAATYAGVSFEAVRLYRIANPEFQKAHEEALAIFREGLESEALKRAIDGWDESVYQKGELVGSVHKFSERLLELVMKANMPDKYRENVKITADVTGGVLIIPEPLSHEAWVEKYGPKELPGPSVPGAPSLDTAADKATTLWENEDGSFGP